MVIEDQDDKIYYLVCRLVVSKSGSHIFYLDDGWYLIKSFSTSLEILKKNVEPDDWIAEVNWSDKARPVFIRWIL